MNYLLSGALAGGTGYTLTLPIDFVKQHLQNGKSFSSIHQVIKQKPSILFRGGSTGLYSIVPQMALKYYSLGKLNNYFPLFISSFSAGFIDGAFLGPILAYQSLQQLNIENKKINSKKIIFKNFGSLMLPMALRNSIYTSVLFSSFPTVKNYLFPNSNLFYQNFLSAFIVNIPACIFCSPFDVLRANHIYNLLHHNQGLLFTSKEIIKNKKYFVGFQSLLLNFSLRFPLTVALQIYFNQFIP